jgi:hypothetical protein
MQDSIQSRRAAIAMPAVLVTALVLAIATAGAEGLPNPGEASAVSPAPQRPGFLDYAPGRGARLGDTGLALGGYANANLVRDEGHRAHLNVDDVSLFVTWDPASRVHLFSELEFEDLVDFDDHGHHDTAGWDFVPERLYGDFTLLDGIGLRVGKFLTPVGRWNVIHAQPLVWTTSRPLATELPFDPHTTGAMLFGSLYPRAGTVSYALYGQFTGQFEERPQAQLADRSGGARVEYEAPGGWAAGGSYLAFTRDGLWQHLTGLDGVWRHGPVELMGEVVHEDVDHGPGSQWGLYLQSVGEVATGLFLVGRYEHYDQRSPAPEVNLVIPGVAWKPRPYLVLKAEYLIADHRAEESPPGFKCSVAVLF